MMPTEALLLFQLSFLTAFCNTIGTSMKERFARSPDSEQIRHWKLAFSDDLAPVGFSRRLSTAVSCQWALNELCLRHVSCHELWTLFRRNCAVDAQNQCQMANKNDCWQSFEGISWTGLGSCTCAGNNSDCHWIRLQTNYNKCIYELNHDKDWHAHNQLSTAAQFSSRKTTKTFQQEGNLHESDGVEKWRDERQRDQWREQDGKETIRENGEEEKKKKGTSRISGGGEEGEKERERSKNERKKNDDIEKESQRKEKEREERKKSEEERQRKEKEREESQRKKSEEERQRKEKEQEDSHRKKSEEERRRRIAKEEERKKKYEEERKRWREQQQRRRERKKDENEVNLTEIEEKQTKERNNSSQKKVEEKQTEGKEHLDGEKRMEEKQTEERVYWSTNRSEHGTMRQKEGGNRRIRILQKTEDMRKVAGSDVPPAERAKAIPNSDNSSNRSRNEVPTLELQQISPTAESQRLITQMEQPPTEPRGGGTATTTASSTTTPFEEKQSKANASEVSDAMSPNGIGWPSSCPAVLSLCDMDEPCRWHLSELRIKCGHHHGACGRRRHAHCAQALHRFVNFVHAPLAQAMVFCECASEDANCRTAMFPFLNDCSERQNWTIESPTQREAISKPQWTCTQTMKLCRMDNDCRRLQSVLRSTCPMAASSKNASAVRCAIPTPISTHGSNPSLSACRAALAASRGSWLDEACFCPGAELEGGTCAELFETKWPDHPCIGVVRHHFNEQLRNGQLSLEMPTYPRPSNSFMVNDVANDRRNNVLVHLGKFGEKGAMEMGGEVTVLTPAGRREENGGDPFAKEGNGHKKEKYQWKLMNDANGEGKEEQEEQRARKLDNDKAGGEADTAVNGRGRNEAGRETRKRKNETEMLLNKDDKLEPRTKSMEKQLNGHKLKMDDDGKGAQKADERKRKMRIRGQQKLEANEDGTEEPFETTFITPKLHIEGEGCPTRNVDGEWVTHYGDTVFRHFHDWAGRCSSWCECKSNGSLLCHQLGCFSDAQCEALHTTIGFGQRLYLEGRGACQCHDGGRFICDTSELMPDLPPGLYITMGYSKAELDLIRKNVPKAVLETSGLISQSTSHAKDLAARVQFALERVLPESTKCRVVLLEHFAKEEVLLMQIQWFGIEPAEKRTMNSKQQNDNGNKRPKWHSGKWEKLCAPFVRELELTFLLERADRYQLLLSTIKQIRVIDLLEGLPPAAALSSASSAATAEKASNLFIRLLLAHWIFIHFSTNFMQFLP
ncbi:hypothetical protein niasHT_019441 [Heterodera trifolii]|uniref:GDNF/GAS1 domain-containing protein n=1 Tax=Heterodera trifolii TaxID=157864 RepID=A0ABD2KVS0_9BILA